MFLGEEAIAVFHFSAFPHASWYHRKNRVSQFCRHLCGRTKFILYSGQGEPPASMLLTLPSCSHSVCAVRTGISKACLEVMPSAALSASLPLRHVFHIHLVMPSLSLLTHSGPHPACCCYRLPCQSYLFLCCYTYEALGGQGMLKTQESWKCQHSVFCHWTNKRHGKIPLSSLKHLEVWLSVNNVSPEQATPTYF